MKRRMLLSLLVSLGLLVALTPGMAAGGTASGGAWLPTGSLGECRTVHTATLLADGRVLVAGGYADGPLATAELYDPAAGQWTATGSLAEARVNHSATLLPDGRVLVAGGSADGVTKSTAELYDPAAGQWTPAAALLHPRQIHTATLLPDGRVLVAGGTDGYSDLSTAELYDPATGQWTATGSLVTGRRAARAVRLADGRVLVAGGLVTNATTPSAELYDPATGQWTPTGSLATARYTHTATLLPDGRVLVAGGTPSAFYPEPLSGTELYDPATGQWTAGSDLLAARVTHSATRLPDGQVLVAGGLDADLGPLVSAELYDPAAGTWTATGSLAAGRGSHSATLLPDGRVLAAGGDGGGPLCSAELYGPGALHLAALPTAWTAGPQARTYHLLAFARVHDQGHVAAGGVTVYGDWTLPDGRHRSRQAVTDARGLARFGSVTTQAGTFLFCVTGMVKSGYAYDPGSNHVPACKSITVGP